jgi:hypothetical protein
MHDGKIGIFFSEFRNFRSSRLPDLEAWKADSESRRQLLSKPHLSKSRCPWAAQLSGKSSLEERRSVNPRD